MLLYWVLHIAPGFGLISITLEMFMTSLAKKKCNFAYLSTISQGIGLHLGTFLVDVHILHQVSITTCIMPWAFSIKVLGLFWCCTLFVPPPPLPVFLVRLVFRFDTKYHPLLSHVFKVSMSFCIGPIASPLSQNVSTSVKIHKKGEKTKKRHNYGSIASISWQMRPCCALWHLSTTALLWSSSSPCLCCALRRWAYFWHLFFPLGVECSMLPTVCPK